MKKLILTLLFTLFFIPVVNAEVETTYLIKDGIEQIDITGGHIYTLVDAFGPIAEEQREDYICLGVKQWGRAEFVFNNMFDFSKVNKIYIEYDYPTVSSGGNGGVELKFKNNEDLQFFLVKNSAVQRQITEIDLSNYNSEDYLYINLVNLTTNNYVLYNPFNVYNLWFESDKVEEPEVPEIIPDTTLGNFYTIYLDKLKSLSSYAMENKFILSAIGIILLFIVLEIILNLFNRGGARK